MQSADVPTMTPGGVLVQDIPGEWWAIRVRGGVEKDFARGLEKRGIDYFLPLQRIYRNSIPVCRAVVPGYIFVAGGEVQISYASEQRNFCGFLQECLKASTRDRLKADLINFQIVLNSDKVFSTVSFVPGQFVLVVSGSLKDARGIFYSHKGKGRLSVGLHLLGDWVSTDIDESQVEAA